MNIEHDRLTLNVIILVQMDETADFMLSFIKFELSPLVKTTIHLVYIEPI